MNDAWYSLMRWRKLLIVLAVFAAIIAIIVALIPREPKFEGRTLSEWIKDSAPKRSPDPETTRAVEAVRHIGTNGLPWLLKWISATEPPAWKVKLNTASARLPQWIRLRVLPRLLGLNSYNYYRRLALDGFLILGPDAAPAVPQLLRIVAKSPKGASPASGVLDGFERATVLPHALSALTNRDNSIELRAAAAMWLSRAAPNLESETVTSVMKQCVRENNPNFAQAAAVTLASRGLEPALVIPYLTNCLSNPNLDIRAGSAFALRGYHQDGSTAVPALVKALSDTDFFMRQLAADALFEIDPEAFQKAAPLEAHLRRERRQMFELERRRFEQQSTGKR
jgi:HEAT repeats